MRSRLQRMDRMGRWLGLSCLALAFAHNAAAQPTPAPELSGQLNLKDAVNAAFRLAPDVRLARAQADYQWGSYVEAKGPFDLTLSITPSVSHSEDFLSDKSRSDEESRRRAYYELAKAFGTMREQIAEMIEQGLAGLPPCPPGLIIQRSGIDNTGVPTYICAPPYDYPYSADDQQRLQNELSTLFNPTLGGGNALDLLDFESRLAQRLGVSIPDYAESIKQRGLDQTREYYNLATQYELQNWLNLERRGIFPEHEWVRRASLDLSLSKLTLGGTQFELAAHGEGVEDNFNNKPLDPKFGGKGIPNVFRSGVYFTLTQPLMRGRGKRSTGAGERAAHSNWQAAQDQYRFSLSQQVLNTVQAHLDLLAAQRSLALLEASASLQKKLVDVTQILVKAGETARADLTRAQARRAEVDASVAQARTQLLAARAAEAAVIGLPPESGSSIVAGGSFVDDPPEIDVEAAAQGALDRRYDLQAARSARDAAQALFDGADLDTRARLDLTVRVGMEADYYGPFFRVLKDEFIRDTEEPTDTPVHFYDPRGIYRTFTDNWQPQLLVQLTWQLPFGNHAQRGRRVQASASLRRSEIQATNLSRIIQENVAERTRTLERARNELRQRTEAARNQEITWNNAQALHQAGQLDLIRALLTEQDLTQSRLRLVQARHDYALAVVRLRHESGTLVRVDAQGAPTVALDGLVSDAASSSESGS